MYIVYTKDNCTYCDQAKNLLKEKGIDFQAIKLGEGITRDELLAKIPTAKSMPQILKGDQLIGGFMELKLALSA